MSEAGLKYQDEIDKVIAEHGGDAHAAIAMLLSDKNFLIKELEYASLAIGHGYARGWKPKTFTARG